jgi:flap endonuclease-1
MFYRTIRLISNGIKPVYVFDGKPPTLKSGELAKRYEKRGTPVVSFFSIALTHTTTTIIILAEAEADLRTAEEEGNAEEIEKLAKRTVKVSKTHNEEAKRLLRLMGVPVVEAPCEAEATCAALARAGLVFAAGSEDMDTLTFTSPVLLRHLTFAEARKMPISEISFDKMLEGLKLNINEFVDLCILLGCDYCDTIKGIGPKRAWELIEQYRSIEKIIENLDLTKHPLPEPFPFEDARELFLKPVVVDTSDLKLEWTEPDEDELIKFLVTEKNFSEERIRSGVEKLRKARATSVQGRLTSFFGQPVTKTSDLLEKKKRSADDDAAKVIKKSRGAATIASSSSSSTASTTTAAATTTSTSTSPADAAAAKKTTTKPAAAPKKKKSKSLFNNKRPVWDENKSS